MSTESRELPELPKGAYVWPTGFTDIDDIQLYSENQMRAYALAALAHSRAQDSGGEAVISAAREVLDTDLGVIGCLGSHSPAEHAIGKLSRAMSEHLNARRFAAEQPAKGEKWRCACGDLNYPNETCAMCNQSAPQQSDPADAVCDCAARVDGGSHSRDCSAYATPPTAQRHDEGEWKHAMARQLIRMADNITEYSAEQMAEKMRQAAYCIATLFSVSNALRDALKKQETDHGAGAAVEAVAWVVEREHDPTFPRLFTTESAADSWVRYVELPPFATKRPLIYGDLPSQQRSEQVAGGGGVDALCQQIATIMREDCPGSTETQILETSRRIAALSTQPLLSYQPAGVRVDHAAQGIKRT